MQNAPEKDRLSFMQNRRMISLLLLMWTASGIGCASKDLSLEPIESGEDKLPVELVDRFKVKTKDGEEAADESSTAEEATEKKKKAKAPKAVAKKKKKKAFRYPNRRPKNDPFWMGEKLVYDVTYFGLVAGTFSVTIQPELKVVNDRKVYHLLGEAKSSKVFEMIYTLDDKINSYIDYEGLFSHRFHMLLNQTRQTRNSIELYDSEKEQVYYWNRRNHKTKGYHEKKEFKKISRYPQDSLSALYYIRTLPLAVGRSFKFPVVAEGKNWEATLKVLKREKMKTVLGTRYVFKTQPETRFKGILKTRGDSFMWFTDDEHRYLVRLEAKVKIGSVLAELREIHPGVNPNAAQKK